MESQNNKFWFKYKGIKERQLIPKELNRNEIKEIINLKRYGLNNKFKSIPIPDMLNNQKLYRERIDQILQSKKKYFRYC